MKEGVSPDGRVQRGARNRQRILDSLFELVGEGNPRPTAEQVADRAGVGTRTVFRHFADMESLLGELNGRITRELEPLLSQPIDPVADVVSRLRAELDWRCAVFERIAPYKRAGNVNRWRSPTLQQAHAGMVRLFRSHLIATLPELDERPAELVDALELVLSFEAWDRLRGDQRLGRDRTRNVLERTARALLDAR